MKRYPIGTKPRAMKHQLILIINEKKMVYRLFVWHVMFGGYTTKGPEMTLLAFGWKSENKPHLYFNLRKTVKFGWSILKTAREVRQRTRAWEAGQIKARPENAAIDARYQKGRQNSPLMI